ncbi:MAG: acyl-CoA thioesterase [Chlamydiae bacterium]|nr:acyl-CoA thioesterase [Chlamydiota bacterium]
MSKYKLTFPEKPAFETAMEVRVSDLNYGGHLGNAQFLELVQEARLRFLKEYGFSESKFYNGALILSNLTAEYKSQAFLGDILTFKICPDNFQRSRFDLFYKVENKDTQKLIALFKTEMVCFDYSTTTILPLPQEFEELFQES